MKVPSADYSPIEQANRAKSNAIKAGYSAADASLWKSRAENVEKSLDISQRSLDLDRESLNVQRWSNVVSTVLGLAQSGVSLAETLYKNKLSKQNQQFQADLTADQRALQAEYLKYGNDIEIITDPVTGERTIVKPEAIITMEKAIQDKYNNASWLEEMKPTVQSGLEGLFADTEFSYLQSAFQRDQEATVALFNQNWKNEMEADIIKGIRDGNYSTPEGVYKLIDGRNDLTDDDKTAMKLVADDEFRLGKVSSDVSAKVYSEGLQSAINYINDELSDDEYSPDDKSELRTKALSAYEQSIKEAAAIGSSLSTAVAQDFTGSTVKGLITTAEYQYSKENGYSAEYLEAVLSPIKKAAATEINNQLPVWVANASLSSGTQSSIEQLTALKADIESGGKMDLFYGQDSLHKSAIATIDTQIAEQTQLWGKNVSAETQAAIQNAENLFLAGGSASDYMTSVQGIVDAAVKAGHYDINDAKVVTESMSKVLKNVDASAQSIFDSTIKPYLYSRLNIDSKTKLQDMDPEQSRQLLDVEFSVYTDLLSYVQSNAGNFDAEQFRVFADTVLDRYTADYFSITSKKNINDLNDAGKVITTYLDGDGSALAPVETISEAGLITLDYSTTGVSEDIRLAGRRAMDEFNQNYRDAVTAEPDYQFVGYDFINDPAGSGNVVIAFHQLGASEDRYVWDPRTPKEEPVLYKVFTTTSATGEVTATMLTPETYEAHQEEIETAAAEAGLTEEEKEMFRLRGFDGERVQTEEEKQRRYSEGYNLADQVTFTEDGGVELPEGWTVEDLDESQMTNLVNSVMERVDGDPSLQMISAKIEANLNRMAQKARNSRRNK